MRKDDSLWFLNGCYLPLLRRKTFLGVFLLKPYDSRGSLDRFHNLRNPQEVDLRTPQTQMQPEAARKSNKKKSEHEVKHIGTTYISGLRDLYCVENQLLKVLPNMAKGASSPELKDAFEKHLEQTKGHVERLEEIFERLDESPKARPVTQ